MSFDDLRQRIIALQDKAFGKGATTEEIAAAQAALGVRFSRTYEQFLREYGWARIGHQWLSPYSCLAIGVCGLGSDVPSHLELVRMTVVERTEQELALPFYLVPIMADGGGNHYCLDTARMENGECPIVFWSHEADEGQIPQVKSLSFDSWLIAMIDELERDLDEEHTKE
jgi:antitoxin YobK